MSAATVVIGVRCHYCSKHRAPYLVQSICDIRICMDCYARHVAAMRSLQSGAPPDECPECRVKFADMPEKMGGNCGDVDMMLVQKDGIYQLLCVPCARQYIPKRADLFKDTAFGARMKLNG